MVLGALPYPVHVSKTLRDKQVPLSISLISEEKDHAAPCESTYHGGLGLKFKFPGDPKKLREASKIKLWTIYLQTHGRNLTLLIYPQCTRLVQVGLPNRLRGEMWETLSGSIFLRFSNPGYYERLLEENKGRSSTSTEDIEEDSDRNIQVISQKRVSARYDGYFRPIPSRIPSWDIASYMSEEQAFWLPEVLCDRLLPGYHSPSMPGTLLITCPTLYTCNSRPSYRSGCPAICSILALVYQLIHQAFLEAHDSGLSEADKALANDLLKAEPVNSK
ncbi:hypothetical protein C8J56DRAFT_883975 [Mycena floridula]|nr:hypothetical protein C8J56DRAFT_883975 [Mycena floridula]